jgi:hypothetical protein
VSRLVQRGTRAPGVEVARKPTPGKRRSGDASLERQADEAAALAMHGNVNVSQVLTPAPPAQVDVPTSASDALPATLRAEAETAFGADFCEVRVHHDPPAWNAARIEEAHAFTAGRDIFLAENQWRPTNDEGRTLVYHELAHALQQTGRRFSTTMIRATETTGGGPIQVQPGKSPRR